MKLKDIKKGEFFTLKPIDEPNESQVYVKGDYLKSTKIYECYKFNYCNFSRYFNGNKEVYTDFKF